MVHFDAMAARRERPSDNLSDICEREWNSHLRRATFIAWTCALALFCFSGVARAGEAQLTLTSAGNIVDANVYVGPYTAQIAGGNSIQIICDNYDTDVNVGDVWKASMETFADPTFVNDVKFNVNTDPNIPGGSTPTAAAMIVLQDYEAAAWLAQQMMSDYEAITPANQSAMDTQIGELDYALFAIFSTTAAHSPGFDAAASGFYTEALGGTYNVSQFSDVEFRTPDASTPFQEYITVAPEPATWLLFGTGLLLVLLLNLRRVKLISVR
jgi:hypothetical protein